MRIGQFADVLGVSRDTVRRLEQRGIIKPRRDWAGHRRFDEADAARARTALFTSAGAAPSDRATGRV